MFLRSFRIAAVTLAVASGAAPAARGKDRVAALFAEPASAVAPSVVKVTCNDKPAALGVAVSSDGLVLTKGSELRGTITCVIADGTAHEATFLGYHKPTDLGLLKIDVTGLKPVTFGPSGTPEVGNWVASVDANGDTIGVGVVSVGVRKLPKPEQDMTFNLNKGFLGIVFSGEPGAEGVLISQVLKNGAAARAGLTPNDLICEVAGKAIKSGDSLKELLEFYRPGETVNIRVKRGPKEMTIKVTLGEGDMTHKDQQNAMGGALSGRRTGFPAILQHDGYLRPIDCGSLLFDIDGKVLGINIARAGRVESWALPVEVIKPVLADLKAGKYPPPGQ